MTYRFRLLVFLTCLSACTDSAPEEPKKINACTDSSFEAHEKTYILTRNRYMDMFSSREKYAAAQKIDPLNLDPYKEEEKVLPKLEKLLLPVIGCVNVDGFPMQGKINITLVRDEIYGAVDGLKYSADNKYLFVTNEGLLKNYFTGYQQRKMGNAVLPNNIGELSKVEGFYQAVFSTAVIIRYVEIPVKASKRGTTAHAFLGVTTQLDGLPAPNEIFVFVKQGKRILMVYDSSKAWDTVISKCLEEKEENSEQLIVTGGAYLSCYVREARNQPFFSPMQKYTQAMVDRLLGH